jgi:O-antigen ligase
VTADLASNPGTGSDRFALRVLEVGSLAVVLAVTTLDAFELDRFFVPKELVLHVAALLVSVAAFRLVRTTAGRVDLFLAAYLLLSAASAAFATNRWVALRALAVSASGALIFWSARALRGARMERPLLSALALAVVVTSITSLLQAYGVDTILFSESRAPGGTLGNRNFVAHVAAFGTPLVLLAALRARSARSWLVSGFGVTIVVGCLALTRSRAAWIAFAMVVAGFAVASIALPPVRSDPRIRRRAAGLVLFAAAGVAAALVLPNALRWRGDSPYLQSVKHVADFQEGSGKGRLVQYRQSLLMALRHPLFGVGPGNWAVEYPAHAAHNDASLNDSEPGTTYNPWPSSDAIAWISERGFPAAVCLALVFLGVLASAWKQLQGVHDPHDALRAVACAATLIGALVAGLFDAVLLTAVPTLLVWAAGGVLYEPRLSTTTKPARVVVAIAIVISAAGAVRSACQLYSMAVYERDSGRSSLERAATVDPGNYRLQLRLARSGGRSRCEHGRAARGLMPHARAAIDAARGCK